MPDYMHEYPLETRMYVRDFRQPGLRENIVFLLITLLYMLGMFYWVFGGVPGLLSLLFTIVLAPLSALAVRRRFLRRGEYRHVHIVLRFTDSALEAYVPSISLHGSDCSLTKNVAYADVHAFEYSKPLCCVRIAGIFHISIEKERTANRTSDIRSRRPDELFLYMSPEDSQKLLPLLGQYLNRAPVVLN